MGIIEQGPSTSVLLSNRKEPVRHRSNFVNDKYWTLWDSQLPTNVQSKIHQQTK